MPEWIKIKISDFYYNAVGESEYTYVTQEVYEALVNEFRKEADAERKRDERNRSFIDYEEVELRDMSFIPQESLEEQVLRSLEIQTLQKAMQKLTEVQKERLRLYFLEGLSTREIAALQNANQNAIWKSISGAIDKLREEF